MFSWDHEQCSKTFGLVTLGSFYYLKDLKHVYYVYHDLPIGKEDQMLFIDDECFKIQNGMIIPLNPSMENCCQKIKCIGWTCHFVCGLPWLDCRWWGQFEFIMTLHGEIFKTLFKFYFAKLLLIPIIYE